MSLDDIELADIRLVASDVDGVLTDGRKWYGPSGLELVAFNVRDGLGVALLQAAGVSVALLTTSLSPIYEQRARDVGVEVHQHAWDKGALVTLLSERSSLRRSQVLFLGDDLWDLSAFRVAGVAVAVADADPDVKVAADVVLQSAGGGGALREVANAVLRARGIQPEELLRECHG